METLCALNKLIRLGFEREAAAVTRGKIEDLDEILLLSSCHYLVKRKILGTILLKAIAELKSSWLLLKLSSLEASGEHAAFCEMVKTIVHCIAYKQGRCLVLGLHTKSHSNAQVLAKA